jgi:GNAT superfamily N-acetyltransferase
MFNMPKLVKHKRQFVFFLDDISNMINLDNRTDISIVRANCENVRDAITFRCSSQIEVFRNFIHEGQYGAYAYMNSKVVGHVWAEVCRKDFCKAEGYIKLNRDEALIHDCNVSEEYRGKGIYPAMLAFLLRLLFREKVARVLIDTEVNNFASVSGIEKVGFKLLGVGTYIFIKENLVYSKLHQA